MSRISPSAVCRACSEEKYEEARLKFVDAMTALGYSSDLAYNVALCYYRQAQYGPALKHIAEIIEKGVREHPELSVGSNTDGIEVRTLCRSRVSLWCADRHVADCMDWLCWTALTALTALTGLTGLTALTAMAALIH